MDLPDIDLVSDAQVAVARRLGIDAQGDTVTVALARIEDALDEQFHGVSLRTGTAKQLDLLEQFGVNADGDSFRVVSAKIWDIMTQLNLTTIREQGLRPGVEVTNVHDRLGWVMVISSITDDGTVYFKGGQGKKAWARSLRRAV